MLPSYTGIHKRCMRNNLCAATIAGCHEANWSMATHTTTYSCIPCQRLYGYQLLAAPYTRLMDSNRKTPDTDTAYLVGMAVYQAQRNTSYIGPQTLATGTKKIQNYAQ